MDHIPLPAPQSRLHVEVLFWESPYHPYVYKPPFLDYPEHCGFSIPEIQAHESWEKYGAGYRNLFLAFLQSWLYFGTISEFLGKKLDLSDWTVTRSTDDAKLVSTRILCEYLEKWISQVSQLSDGAQEAKASHIDKVLQASNEMYISVSTAGNFLTDDLSLSLAILFRTLMDVRNAVLPGKSKLETWQPHGIPLLSEQFSDDGWCKSDHSRLQQHSSIIGMYYSSRLGKLPCLQNHGTCTEGLCLAAQVDESTYKSQHISDTCLCAPVTASTTTIAQFVAQQTTPLLIVDGDGAMRILKGPSCTQGYVAVSHVWADGLGNPHSNQLPNCQVRRMQRQVNNLLRSPDGQPTPFWIDTLCIPVGEAYAKERDLAISALVKTYSEAKMVLVFNKELRVLDAERPFEELVARTTRTTWFRRLWTLQEGVFARELYFQFKDSALCLDNGLDAEDQLRPNRTTSSPIEALIKERIIRDCSQPLVALKDLRNTHPSERVRHLWTAVQWRVTSYASDEPLCLASILHLDLDAILQVPRKLSNAAEERMQAFIRTQVLFPPSSLFESGIRDIGEAPRLPCDGYRWAPRSFCYRTTRHKSIPIDAKLRPANQLGFHVTFPGVMLNWADIKNKPRVFFFTISGIWDTYFRIVSLSDDEPPWPDSLHLSNNFEPALVLEEAIPIQTHRAQNTGFFLDLLRDRKSSSSWDFTAPKLSFYSAILVAVEQSTDRILRGRILADVLITGREYSSSRSSAMSQIMESESMALPSVDDLPTFELTQESQEWCLG
ncbi:uncharacterized protein E0L32_006067 [Thyridium curvatum]|uniref:Heterokaryon incompatibility domain-containing protein n=1 Tax=Thyridium curvatum TaxID=1093900 RepID=A0A507B3F5_9PEZI|nr:uncharacterized protein E0L32_006067 [Thyridium curvatum]TPX13596.1 hypothetical protein E0L32_006067 [Thyridium curvatum]